MTETQSWERTEHIVHREPEVDDLRIVLCWAPSVRRKRGRPRDMWQRMVQKEPLILAGRVGMM